MDLQKMSQEQLDMDMTPMIDCVFLLMIFFVLVIDLSQKNLEDLILPQANYQEPDDSPPDNRPIINVLQNGTVVYEQRVYYDPVKNGKDYAPIRQLLLDIRRKGELSGSLKFTTENIAGRDIELIDDPILIRADKWTEWHYIGEVMKQCSIPQKDPQTGAWKGLFWRVELAMSEVDKELKINAKGGDE